MVMSKFSKSSAALSLSAPETTTSPPLFISFVSKVKKMDKVDETDVEKSE
jgi:hypothetical protein